MAHIRQVRQSITSKKWAYIETSDENPRHVVMLGNKEFDTREEAEGWSKGFAWHSYKWEDPKEIAIKRWTEQKKSAEHLLAVANENLEKLGVV